MSISILGETKTEETQSPEKYKSPMATKGIEPEYARHMFVEPELAAKVNKQTSFWVNDVLRIGFYLRPRQESRYNLDFNRSNAAYVDRTMQTSSLFLLFEPNEYVTGKITIQDARVWGGDSPANVGDIRAVFFNNTPSISSSTQTNSAALNTTGIREAFVMVKKLPLQMKMQVGRQIWAYGDQRMLGGANWTINGLSFDGIRLMYDESNLRLHIFAARPYWTQSGVNGVVSANDPKVNSNAKGSDTTIFGTYNTIKLFDAVALDLYSINVVRKWIPNTFNTATGLPNPSPHDPLALNRAKQNQELYTVGFRLTNRTNGNFLPKDKAWDWTWESAWQGGYTGRRVQERFLGSYLTGSFQNVLTEREKYSGQMHVFQTGYTFFEKLRLGAQWIYASGDKNRTDGSSSSFQTLANPRFSTIPYFNNFAGISENIDTKNIISRSISVSYQTESYGTFQISYFQNDKAEKQDAWYAINGAGNSTANIGLMNSSPVSPDKGSTENFADNPYAQPYRLGKRLYTEVDLTWMGLINDNVSIWIGVGYLRAGDAIANYRNSPIVFNPITGNFDWNADAFLGRNTLARNGSMAYFQVNAAF
nr:alginate export family protein [Leptospira ryugenii]